MFISSKEKLSLTLRVTVLEGQIAQLMRSLNALQDAKTLAPNPEGLKLIKKKKSVKGWTPEARAIHGERIKLMWAKRKAIKAAT